MYDFIYKVFYETARVFIGEEKSKPFAWICCLILPGLVFVMVLSMIMTL